MRALTALAAVAALALLAGCGGDSKTIPKDDAASLNRALRSVRDLAGDPANCPRLAVAVRTVQSRVSSLPASVDQDARNTLVNGVNNLIDNVRSECQNVQTTPTTPPETTPTTPSETTPPTTPSETTPTTPSTTPTTPSNTTPTTPGNGGVTPGNTPTVPPGKGKKPKAGD